MSKNYYDILGVSRTATTVEIKKAFRALAHKHHPDKGGDAKAFQEINRAYQTLSDQKKRAQYDRFGETSQRFQGFGGFDPRAGGFDHAQFYSAFGNGTAGRVFTVASLKKIPLVMWIFLLPVIVLIILFGALFLAHALVNMALRKMRAYK